MGRFLRSKRARALLWHAAGGKCPKCGLDLPDSWHADHVVPHSVSGRTDFFEMQALCPHCNLRKGASFVVYRKFQGETKSHLEEFISGGKFKAIVLEITPGGGKSILPMMAANELIAAGMADFIA